MAALTVFSDVILPNSLIAAAGLQGRNQRNNARRTSQAGFQNINVNWARTLRQYELGFIPMLPAQWRQLEGFHEVTEGGAFGFLISDPKDSSVSATEGLMYPLSGTTLVGTIGLGYGVPTYKLHKRMAAAGTTRTKDRQITRPILSGNILKRDAATITLGGGAGQAALNVDTGVVTLVQDISQGILSITAGATTVINFTSGTPIVAAFSVGERVYLDGLTGTAAAVLNNLSHAITAKGATSLTVSTVTTGLSAGASVGTAYRYPQATEALTWSGSFYVPVHFAGDDIDWSLAAGGPAESRLIVGNSITLQEVRE